MERIGLIGAGRAGTALGAALAAAGHPLVGVTARSSASRERAARLLPHVPVLTADEITNRADVVLVAVPDDLIHQVARELPLTSGQYVVHLSGAHGLEALGTTAATPVALHPAMTFPGGEVSLDGVMFTATAPDEAREIVERLVKALGAQVQWVAEERARALPRRSRARRESPDNVAYAGARRTAGGRGGRSGRDTPAARDRNPRQHAAIRSSCAHRADCPGRCRHGGCASGGAASDLTHPDGEHVRRAGPGDGGAGRGGRTAGPGHGGPVRPGAEPGEPGERYRTGEAPR